MWVLLTMTHWSGMAQLRCPLILIDTRGRRHSSHLRVISSSPRTHHQDHDATPEEPFYYSSSYQYLPMNYLVSVCITP